MQREPFSGIVRVNRNLVIRLVATKGLPDPPNFSTPVHTYKLVSSVCSCGATDVSRRPVQNRRASHHLRTSVVGPPGLFCRSNQAHQVSQPFEQYCLFVVILGVLSPKQRAGAEDVAGLSYVCTNWTGSGSTSCTSSRLGSVTVSSRFPETRCPSAELEHNLENYSFSFCDC